MGRPRWSLAMAAILGLCSGALAQEAAPTEPDPPARALVLPDEVRSDLAQIADALRRMAEQQQPTLSREDYDDLYDQIVRLASAAEDAAGDSGFSSLLYGLFQTVLGGVIGAAIAYYSLLREEKRQARNEALRQQEQIQKVIQEWDQIRDGQEFQLGLEAIKQQERVQREFAADEQTEQALSDVVKHYMRMLTAQMEYVKSWVEGLPDEPRKALPAIEGLNIVEPPKMVVDNLHMYTARPGVGAANAVGSHMMYQMWKSMVEGTSRVIAAQIKREHDTKSKAASEEINGDYAAYRDEIRGLTDTVLGFIRQSQGAVPLR